jgi:spore coat protein U-like protein
MRIVVMLVLGLLWFVAPAAHAQDCTVATTAVAFGSYDTVSATPDDVNGEVEVTCWLEQAPVTISINGGGSNNPAARRMLSGTNQLNYNLYTTPGRTIVFGNGASGSQTVTCTTGVTTGVCVGSTVLFGLFTRSRQPIYGRIPTLQNAAVGSYTDSLTVTVIF